MVIANPIYDVVFKRLMEDNRIAKFFIGTLLEQIVESIEVKPQEFTYTDEFAGLAVFRLDFIATVRTDRGELKKFLIEIQKAKNQIDLMRFRNYLGEQYKKEDIVNENKVILPITTIYILGFKLQNLEASVIKAAHNYIDVVNNLVITQKNDFIEKLTHDCFVIQIPRLQSNLQTKLEKILQIFNQKFVFSPDHKKLVIPKNLLLDNDLHEFFERLSRPLLDETLLKQADLEEELETKLDDMSRTIEVQKQEIVATKEELIGTKEELVGTKEELIGTKEELIGTKEELNTTKIELSIKDAEIAALKALLSQQNNTKK